VGVTTSASTSYGESANGEWTVVNRHMANWHLVKCCIPTGKICTVVILGLETAESLQLRWGQLLVNLVHKPKVDFYDPFALFISILYGDNTSGAVVWGVCMTI